MKKLLFSIIFPALLLVSGLHGQALTSIAEIQGELFRSEKVGSTVKTQGVVTAVRRSGFYIQTPDDKVDANPKTSEGVYVYTKDDPPSKVKVGSLVEVKGEVAEFRARQEQYGLFLTEIVNPDVEVLSDDNPLPKPFVLTREFLDPKGQLDQLEPLEGMRVQIDDLTVVAPTGGFEDRKNDVVRSDGVFFGVLTGTPRPFREPGLDALTVLFEKLPQTLPIFDMNPEVLRIHSSAIDGAGPIDVATGAKIKNMVGIMDYGYQKYTVLVDPSVKPLVEEGMKPVPASPAGEREITVASFNLENFFDDENNSKLDREETKVSGEKFKRRLKKASLAIRNILSMPDVLGVIEVENLKVLQKLAKRINEDAAAAGADPKYVAYLEDGNDIRGIDVGYLVKSSKVRVVKTEQLAGDIKLKHKDANPKEHLFDRPPLLLQAEVADAKTGGAFAFTVIVNHFKSFLGVDDPRDGDRVRNKRRMEAEWVAKFVSEREQANPDEKIIVMGDFNAFQFNDGYNDLLGILRGRPERNIITPAEEIVETGLVNLVEYISADSRYSYTFGGNAQTIDHILINRPLRDYAVKFGYARLDADFPEVLANDENRPERISDHDGAVLYLTMDGKSEK